MDNHPLLEQLADSGRKQERYARIQCFFTVAAAVFCLLILLTALRVVPQIQVLAEQIRTISVQAQAVLTNLETVTDELAQADISGMVSGVDSLVSSSQEGVQQALEKINAIDIGALNQAIEDLAKIVSPLANIVTKLQSLPF